MTLPKRGLDRQAAERAIALFLEALGYDPSDPLLVETPNRVATAFATELLRGAQLDLRELLAEGSEPCTPQAGVVILRRAQVVTVCPHHLLPGVGTGTVAYLPGERWIGLGTLARLVDACSRRLALQEAIGEAVVSALTEHAGARGAYCRIELLHTCLAARGAEQPEARLITVAERGELSGPDASARLLLALHQESAE